MKIHNDGTITISREDLITATALMAQLDKVDADDERVDLYAEFAYSLGILLFDMGETTKRFIEENIDELEEAMASDILQSGITS